MGSLQEMVPQLTAIFGPDVLRVVVAIVVLFVVVAGAVLLMTPLGERPLKGLFPVDSGDQSKDTVC